MGLPQERRRPMRKKIARRQRSRGIPSPRLRPRGSERDGFEEIGGEASVGFDSNVLVKVAAGVSNIFAVEVGRDLEVVTCTTPVVPDANVLSMGGTDWTTVLRITVRVSNWEAISAKFCILVYSRTLG